MRRVFHWVMAATLMCGAVAFNACSKEDKEEAKVKELTAEMLEGLWVADYAQSATENGKTWTRVIEDFLFRADGTGYWEIYLLDANKLVGVDGNRDNDLTHYTISGNTVNITIDNSIIECTLTYADGKLTDPEGTIYHKATTEQQTAIEQLYSDWQGMNSGEEDDGSTIKTDVNDSYTDEPARAPKR